MTLSRSPRPIRSVLVANRGEIAVRVIRTCKRLGIRTIAVYSDADVEAPHVAAADEAVRIGPAPVRESYLDMDGILVAAGRAEADSIHPGYGFLAENASFARRCEAEGIVFIGPSPDIVAAMGSKIEAKRIAEAADVPTVPGYHGGNQSGERLAAEAARIGFPVLIKASAGGGGRGMRRVDRAGDFAQALADARDEAQAAFGDSNVLIEKLIANPRHLEVQLFGDRRGNLVHLFERDCSVQRNNQKLLEESPAPNLSPDVRKTLFAAALKLGRAIGYDSAGTVEFIMDANEACPFFLEMNTRLQVEHPVTECVTGIDLVEWQLLAAAGEELPLEQDGIRLRGHAIEARLTAERADLDFQPAHGRLSLVAPPKGIRFDSGVASGSKIGLHYDSLLAKLIAHAKTREAALARLQTGLENLDMLGLPTNQPFLIDAVRHPLFAEGRVTTEFIGKAFPHGWQAREADIRTLRACAAAVWLGIGQHHREDEWTSPWQSRNAIRVMGAARPASVEMVLADEYGTAAIDLRADRSCVTVQVDGTPVSLGGVAVSDGIEVWRGTEAAERLATCRHGELVEIARNGLGITASIGLRVDAPRKEGDGASGEDGGAIRAPLPGLISQIYVESGDPVEKGAALFQMEAMKLVHTLTTPIAGRVGAVNMPLGATVSAGSVVMEIVPRTAKETI